MSSPQLCGDCETLVKWLSSNPDQRPNYQYPKDGQATIESAEQCRLCRMITWRFGTGPSSQSDKKAERITLQVERDWDGFISTVEVTHYWSPKNFSCTKLPIWTEKENTAHSQGGICTLPPLGCEGGEDTLALISTWVKRCKDTHKGCRETIGKRNCDDDDDSTPFPSDRMLDVGSTVEDRIRLVSSAGIQGKYISLSHCWGPVDKKPLCVTRENESQFFDGVRIDELPKTFQHAVILTRGLGLRYLWVDSLCILQDSEEHWRYESARMGAIYEHAYLRLAAAGAHDSTQGLLFPHDNNNNNTITVTLPYTTSSPSTGGEFYLSSDGRGFDDPSWGPLADRAWAFQESRLARRSVSFMPLGITWECKNTYWNSRNCFPYDHHDARAKWTTWETNIENYSAGKLTYEKDRLVAIQGLANEFGKAKEEQYLLGIWLKEGDIPKQLLWRIFDRKTGMQGLPNLPSWTWARHRGRKQYLCEIFYVRPVEEQIGTRLAKIEDDGNTLTLSGTIRSCHISKQDVHGKAFAFRPPSPESMMVTHWSSLRRCIWADHSRHHLIGLVQLDDDGDYDTLFYTIILVAERKGGDPLRKDDEGNQSGHGPNSPFASDGTAKDFYTSSTPQAKGPNADTRDWDMIQHHGAGTHYYWVLLLNPVEGRPDHFHRVGTGIVWPTRLVEDRPPDQLFHLI